jgi:hypothetical protein
MKWWDGKLESMVIAPPERDRLAVLYEELVDSKSRLDELGAELKHFIAQHRIVQHGYGHTIRGCRPSGGWTRSAIDAAWLSLWRRISAAGTHFHVAQTHWSDEKMKREKNAKQQRTA